MTEAELERKHHPKPYSCYQTLCTNTSDIVIANSPRKTKLKEVRVYEEEQIERRLTEKKKYAFKAKCIAKIEELIDQLGADNHSKNMIECAQRNLDENIETGITLCGKLNKSSYQYTTLLTKCF